MSFALIKKMPGIALLVHSFPALAVILRSVATKNLSLLLSPSRHRRKSNQNSTETLFPEYSFGNGCIGLEP
jgi:hypothetical protein